MEDIIDRSHQNFTHFKRRGLVPLITDGVPLPRYGRDVPNPENVQGDVIYLFPKVAEDFIFFRISNVTQFRKDLASFNPTHGKQVYENLVAIHEEKTKDAGTWVKVVQKQIAFSRPGLNILGLTERTGDNRFDVYSMRDNKMFLGDGMPWDSLFDKPNPDPVNGTANVDDGAIHGLITIAGSDDNVCTAATNATLAHFQRSFESKHVTVLHGRTRPGAFKGHEHFGYRDGISQPAMRKLIAPLPGQTQVDPGVIVAGYKGDPALDKRPKWVKDGSFMAFRKLEQLVPEFTSYVAKNGPRWAEFVPKVVANPPLTAQEGTALWGARMFGRFRSGAPLAKTPVRDDPEMADNPLENNNFDYTVPGVTEPTDQFCPFTAHVRKTAPRNLDPYLSKQFLEAGSIVRAGLPYGPEVTPAEQGSGTSSNEDSLKRGLMFVCYQSDLDSGFVRQTIGYANNDFFPTVSLIPRQLGQDPIIGGPSKQVQAFAETPIPAVKSGDAITVFVRGKDEQQLEVSGFALPSYAGAQSPPGVPQDFFVNSRGGEYFFVPSISTLRDISRAR